MEQGSTGQTELAVVTAWLASFERALASGDATAAARLFAENSHWRDILAFTWVIDGVSGRAAIADRLRRTLPTTQPAAFTVPPNRTQPRWAMRAGREVIEALISFKTSTGSADGVLRLVPAADGSGGYEAWVLMTALQEITGHEERIGRRRPSGEWYSRDFGGENWLDLRKKAQAYADREPAVVVIGAGQAGLGITARLHALGVDTLLVDRNEKIGDNWRNRYHALVLHNEAHVNHLPYMPFPETWPTFIPKDLLATWFEAYAECMELNVWSGTEMVSGDYDERAGRWRLVLRRADGSERIVRPHHLVLATGVSAIPVMPKLPGLSEFTGTVMHSGTYTEGHAFKGKKALVIGTGNSGHDVAQDLYSSGADVTLVQRSTTYVVSLREAQKVYAIYNEIDSMADCDLLAVATPHPLLVKTYQLSTAEMKVADKELLDGLTARGFRLDDGEPDGTGFQMKYLRRGGGYYFNVGCSDLIIAGKIGLAHYADIETFTADGARLKDGGTLPADLIVLATGYKSLQDTARAYLGDAIADRIGPVWGFDDRGELANMWQRTPQPGLWFTAGSLAQSRIFSKYLALQIKACEAGLISPAKPAHETVAPLAATA